MVDNFALALIHGLLALAAWRLLMNDALDRDPLESETSETPAAAKKRGRRG